MEYLTSLKDTNLLKEVGKHPVFAEALLLSGQVIVL
jgi:hypothetical protein